MNRTRYSMSFTSGGLLLVHSSALAQLYLQLTDWSRTRKFAASQNLFQSRTQNAFQRTYIEISTRLKTLTSTELRFLSTAPPAQQAALLWIAVCRRYLFIAEFTAEVLRERCHSLLRSVSSHDFDAFFNRRAEWHPELDQISSTTRTKLRQVLFRMLRESKLLHPPDTLALDVPCPAVTKLLLETAPNDLRFFPAFPPNPQELPL